MGFPFKTKQACGWSRRGRGGAQLLKPRHALEETAGGEPDLSSLQFINPSAAVICGGDPRCLVFTYCNVDCWLELDGMYLALVGADLSGGLTWNQNHRNAHPQRVLSLSSLQLQYSEVISVYVTDKHSHESSKYTQMIPSSNSQELRQLTHPQSIGGIGEVRCLHRQVTKRRHPPHPQSVDPARQVGSAAVPPDYRAAASHRLWHSWAHPQYSLCPK